ncbi:MAG: iron ABC transporter permease [Deltaproteobacteria bacterium]|nr:MAG: iron ABC transporter permease [Deltaproteobacteria bacterium]
MARDKLSLWIGWMAALSALLLVVVLFSLGVGAVALPWRKIPLLLFHGRGTAEYAILFQVRLPRVLLGAAVGGALSVAGVVLQGMFRNPLVEPYTLGISGGAALGVSLAVVLGSRGWSPSLPASGFLGAVGVVLLVYGLSSKGGGVRLTRLLLIGVMVSFMASSLIMLLMALSRVEDLHGIVFWIMGSLEEADPRLLRIVVLSSLAGLMVSFLFAVDLNALALGEEEAFHLGVRVERVKKALFLLASLLTGICVSVTGIIGFVGLVVPHLMRLLVGGDHRILLLSSYIAGGAFLVLCDTLARTVVSPVELPVGVVTGIVGGATFVYVLSKKGG